MKWFSKRHVSQLITKGESRISDDSVLFRKALPALLIGMVLILVVLILVAAGILIDFIPFF
jgi:hypothetical protein